MSLSLAFWIAMFVWLLVGIVGVWPRQNQPVNFSIAGGSLLLFILLLLLGWKVFNAPLHS